jgi:hypothetical protein
MNKVRRRSIEKQLKILENISKKLSFSVKSNNNSSRSIILGFLNIE